MEMFELQARQHLEVSWETNAPFTKQSHPGSGPDEMSHLTQIHFFYSTKLIISIPVRENVQLSHVTMYGGRTHRRYTL